MNVLCVGLNPAIDTTLSLDVLTLGAVNRTFDSQSRPAGKALNVATLLSTLGVSVVMTGFLGQDNSDDFVRHFDECNIANDCVFVKGKTRQNIKLAERDGRMTDVNGAGFVVADDDKANLFEKLPALCQRADVVVVSGSLPQGFELADWQQLLTLIKANNDRLVVDTSGKPLALAVDFAPFLIKPNKDELLEAFGSDDVFAERLAGVSHLVLSDGANGVKWRTNGQVLHATSPKVDVKSTVGAGDSLLAGVVYGLLAGDDKADILRRAVAMASHSVSVVGVEVPDDVRLSELMAEIKSD